MLEAKDPDLSNMKTDEILKFLNQNMPEFSKISKLNIIS
jgi:hypothetical protein